MRTFFTINCLVLFSLRICNGGGQQGVWLTLSPHLLPPHHILSILVQSLNSLRIVYAFRSHLVLLYDTIFLLQPHHVVVSRTTSLWRRCQRGLQFDGYVHRGERHLSCFRGVQVMDTYKTAQLWYRRLLHDYCHGM